MTNRERLILDNAGGATLQLGTWAHDYAGDDLERLADDIAEWVRTRTTQGWDGHDDDAAALDPTLDRIRSGGYVVIDVDDLDSLREDDRTESDLRAALTQRGVIATTMTKMKRAERENPALSNPKLPCHSDDPPVWTVACPDCGVYEQRGKRPDRCGCCGRAEGDDSTDLTVVVFQFS